MDVSLTYPAALWALLGLPAVLLLHFLQSKSRTARVSTLFLLDYLQEDTRKGAIFTRLRTGWQLWLQLLAVLLLTLLLIQPRVLKEESVQTVAVVVDSSSSMQAFEAELALAAEDLVDRMGKVAGETRWWVLPSDAARPRLAVGSQPEEVLASIDPAAFLSGPHDPAPRLREARALVGPDGVVIYLTDHADRQVSPGTLLISVGRPRSNVSLTGLRFDVRSPQSVQWRVSVVNRSSEPVTGRVRLKGLDGSELASSTVSLPSGGMKTVEGLLPDGVMQGTLELAPEDAFPRDNVIPFVRPLPKPIVISSRLEAGPVRNWLNRITALLPGAVTGPEGDVRIGAGSAVPAASDLPGRVLFRDGGDTAPYARILPARHPLVEDLDWDSLLVQPFSFAERSPADLVLLRMGDVPLVLLRTREGGTDLVLNFDPAAGNGLRHAGLALLIYRYFAGVQQDLDVAFRENVLTGQKVRLPPAEYTFQPLTGQAATSWTPERFLPDQAGWLTGMREGQLLVTLACAPGDVEEGDLRQASSQPLSKETVIQQRRRHEESDLLLPLWMTLLGMTVVGSWWAGADRRSGG